MQILWVLLALARMTFLGQRKANFENPTLGYFIFKFSKNFNKIAQQEAFLSFLFDSIYLHCNSFILSIILIISSFDIMLSQSLVFLLVKFFCLSVWGWKNFFFLDKGFCLIILIPPNSLAVQQGLSSYHYFSLLLFNCSSISSKAAWTGSRFRSFAGKNLSFFLTTLSTFLVFS